METLTAPARTSQLHRLLWWILIFSCLIGGAAAIRRMVALSLPPSSVSQLRELDQAFDAKATLTWIHISCGLLFVSLVPFQFVASIRHARPTIHHQMDRPHSHWRLHSGRCHCHCHDLRPSDRRSERSRRHHHVWRTLFVLPVARPVVHPPWQPGAASGVDDPRQRDRFRNRNRAADHGVFFATSRLTHLTPHDFFGTAFWIGFTINLIAAEAWRLNYTRRASPGFTPL